MNPFPGPQPYRAADRDRFFAREEMSEKLESSLLARRCVTIFGPSGAGKSSLMQAAVIPRLVESREVRVVRVDSWPEGELPARWLAEAMYAGLELGSRPEGMGDVEAVVGAAQRAARRSERPILIYLDQIEQTLLPSRIEGLDDFVECTGRLSELPLRGLHLVLSLREDYLGRLRDRLRGRRRLLEHGFRVAPLSVAQMVEAVCAAAEAGEPKQHWSEGEIRALMLEVRTPGESPSDEAEVQTAFGQIVCRALWEERAAGKASDAQVIRAEAILHRYLEATVEEMGELKTSARQLLEEHLVDAEGRRRLLTEAEVRAKLGDETAAKVLERLEKAAVLHAEEHQGSRYFEIGHDWLANKVLERRKDREAYEANWKREMAERAARMRLGVVATLAIVATLLMAAFVVWALSQREKARAATMMVGARELAREERFEQATLLLQAVAAEVKDPRAAPAWEDMTREVLAATYPKLTLGGRDVAVVSAAVSPDSRLVLTGSLDKTAHLWRMDGPGKPTPLKVHDDGVVWAALSPDGEHIVTASSDGFARIWSVHNSERSLARLNGHRASLLFAAFSPDGEHVVTSADHTARVWKLDGSLELERKHHGPVLSAKFSGGSRRIVTVSDDSTARILSLDDPTKAIELTHDSRVLDAAFNPMDGQEVVTVSEGGAVKVWHLGTSTPSSTPTTGHCDKVNSVAFSLDGKRFVTASDDGTARVWRVDRPAAPLTLKGHTGSVRSAEFNRDGTKVVTASDDGTARIWHIGGIDTYYLWRFSILRGHHASVRSATFNAEGTMVVTTSSDRTARVWDVPMGGSESIPSDELQGRLRALSLDGCLTPDQRQKFLDETAPDARDAYSRCEVEHGRTPRWPP